MKKYWLILLLSIYSIAQSFAVFNEKDLPQTLSVLRYELKTTNDKFAMYGLRLDKREILQHGQLMQMLDRCDELSLMLYSQKQDYTFDLTYACHEINRMYGDLQKYREPFLNIMNRLNIEVERYKDLKASLERIPATARNKDKHSVLMNQKVQSDRKACLQYVNNLLAIYSNNIVQLNKDDADYALANKRLKELNTYAQKRYGIVKHKIFIKGQTNYFDVLGNLPTFASRAYEDAVDKYKSGVFNHEHSEWRGPIVVGFTFFVLIYLAIAVIVSNIIVRLLRRKLKWMQTNKFKEHKVCMICFVGSLLFALSIMIAEHFVHHNFFILASGLLSEFAWMLTVIFASLLIRLKGTEIKSGIRLYIPIIVMGLIVITFRVIFIPNRMINLIFPPLMVIFILWQIWTIHKEHAKTRHIDAIYSWISALAMILTAVVAWSGYVLLSVQVIIWWLFQLSVIQTITTVYYLMRLYSKLYLSKRLRAYRINHKLTGKLSGKDSDIEVTWFFNLIQMTVIPVLVIYSIPYCTYMAADVFDLSIVCRTFYSTVFLNVPNIIQLSPYILFAIASLFFVFYYINYAVTASYRHYKLRSLFRSDGTLKLHANTANLTLFENLISIIIWGIYVITAMVLLHIPKEGITFVTAGLATGIGFAMKDILNNFFYGIQLMAGRVRIGDYIECDNVRGRVESITYQSTQITTIDGCVMAFLNSALFNKNFKNLTKNHDYELVVIPVSVSYGSDINYVRNVILEAMKAFQVKDELGRNLVSPTRKITVEVQEFGDNSVGLQIKQLVLVDHHLQFMSDAREAIYNALTKNHIEIPFPQRDVHIKEVVTK
jgi:potassium efflux system protein